MDLFHYLVSLCFSLPSLYVQQQQQADDSTAASTAACMPRGGLSDLHTLKLVFAAHVVQIMLTAAIPEEGQSHQQPPSPNKVSPTNSSHPRTRSVPPTAAVSPQGQLRIVTLPEQGQ